MSHLLLVGFMGAGKSSAGRLAATALELPFVDLDSRIELRAEASVADVFATSGEDAFRELEHAELASLADQGDAVVACGGGVVLRDDNRALLNRLGTVVYLEVSAGVALSRIGDVTSRPLLAGSGAAIAATRILEAREALYRAVADIVIDTEGMTLSEVADAIVSCTNEMEGVGR